MILQTSKITLKSNVVILTYFKGDKGFNNIKSYFPKEFGDFIYIFFLFDVVIYT